MNQMLPIDVIPDDLVEDVWRRFADSSLDLNRPAENHDCIEIKAFMQFAIESVFAERKRCEALCREVGKIHDDGYYNIPSLCADIIIGKEELASVTGG